MPGTYFGPHTEQYSVYAEETGKNCGRWDFAHKLILPDGREYAFCKMGAVVGVAGSLYQSVASVGNYTDLVVPTASAIGATSLHVTLGGTAATIDQFTEGVAHVNDGTGESYVYRIKKAVSEGASHPAQTSTTGNLEVQLETQENVQVATIAGDSTISLTQNRFDEVIIHVSPPTAGLAGVAPGPTTISYYGWTQIKGYAGVLTDGTLLEGNEVQASITTNGAVEGRKTRVTASATTAADVTAFILLEDQDGSNSTVAVGTMAASTVQDITGPIAGRAPACGLCIEANASAEHSLIDLMVPA